MSKLPRSLRPRPGAKNSRAEKESAAQAEIDNMYFWDFPTKRIGGGNPYHKCVSCGISVPQINGKLNGHSKYCEWRIAKEQELGIR